jgi:hypothetical protein
MEKKNEEEKSKDAHIEERPSVSGDSLVIRIVYM